MIKLLDRAERLDFCGPLYVRIMSCLTAYGLTYSFARFYLQYIDKKATALISVIDDNATVVTSTDADIDEISAFLPAVGVKSVLSDKFLKLACPVRLKSFYKDFTETKRCDLGFDYKKAYKMLLCLYPDMDFDSWYVDLSHRVRHGCAVAAGTDSGCMCAAKHLDETLITGIAVLPECRMRGEGKALVGAAASMSGAKRVWALCDDKQAQRFYLKCGFSENDPVYSYKMEEENETGLF